MVHIKIKISISDKELLVNPNCPVKILYNFIQKEVVQANTHSKPNSSESVNDSTVPSIPKKEESRASIKHRVLNSKSRDSSTGNRSSSKTSSVIPRLNMPLNQEYDLCDEKGNLKQIYNLEPWVNGWETGIFVDRATYIVVIFDRDERGAILNPQAMVPKSFKHYSDLMLKIRRQSRNFSKQKLVEEKISL